MEVFLKVFDNNGTKNSNIKEPSVVFKSAGTWSKEGGQTPTDNQIPGAVLVQASKIVLIG